MGEINKNSTKIEIKHYTDLSRDELFHILKIRQDIFIIEQECLYEDIDDLDEGVYHAIVYYDNKICGTSRIIQPNINNNFPRIGRIAVHKNYRNLKIGKMLIEESIHFSELKFKKEKIKISAQLQLQKYYETFGFIKTSEPYDEDGIMHIDMVKNR